MAKFKVVCGDMLKILGAMDPNEPIFDMTFADPPFGLGQKYTGFVDKFTAEEYESFTSKWIRSVWYTLKPNGIMALHGNDDLCELYYTNARHWGFKDNRIAHIIWHYRFGQHQDANWINSHAHCLIFAKDADEYTWNPDSVLVESDRRSRYGDPRAAESARRGSRVPLTVWGVPSDGPNWGRVQGNSRERRVGHPNQLPEVYLERLIKAYTNPGGKVLDPFGGSGTTAVVSLKLGRDVMTIDISPESCESIRARIKEGAVRL